MCDPFKDSALFTHYIFVFADFFSIIQLFMSNK